MIQSQYDAVLKQILAVARTHGVDQQIVPFPPSFARDPIFHVRGRWGSAPNPASIPGTFFFDAQADPLYLAARLSWLHAWVWQHARRSEHDAMRGASGELFNVVTRYDLEAWGVRNYLGHLLDTRAATLGLKDDRFGLWTCADIVGPSPLWDLGQPGPNLRESVLERLREGQRRVARGVEAEAEWAALTTEPSTELRETTCALRELRDRERAFVAPRPPTELPEVALKHEAVGAYIFQEQGPRHCVDRRSGCQVNVNRLRSGEWTVGCSCAYGEYIPCESKLAGLDAILGIAAGEEDRFGNAARTILAELRRAPWQSAVDDLVRLLGEQAVPEEVDGVQARFGWEIKWARPYWETRLQPILVREKKRGSGVMSQRLPKDDWRAAVADLEGVDAVVLGALAAAGGLGGASDWDVLSTLIAQLAGRPNVFYQDGELRKLSIRTRRATARIDMEGGRLRVVPEFGDLVPPASLLESMEMYPQEWAAHLNAANDELQLFTIPPNVVRAVHYADRDELAGPAAEAAVRGATPLLDTGRVTLSGGIRGERREDLQKIALDLEVEQERLHVRMRAIPTKSGATYPAGEGQETVFGADDGHRYFVQRDLASEKERAEATRRRLELPPDPSLEWFLQMPDEALDLVARLEELGSREDLVVRWRTRPLRAGAAVAAKNLTVKVGSMRTWLSLGGSARVEGAEVPIDQLLTAAREGRGWVEVGNGFARIEEKLRRTLASLGDGEVSTFAAPLLVELEEAGASLIGDDSWRSLDARIREAATLEPKVPRELEATLRPYQRDGFRWMSRLAHWATGAVLADDMGLGKTLQALTMLLARRGEGPALVIAPTSLGFNWRREAERFTPTLQVRMIRSGTELGALEDIGSGTVIVTSYGLAARYADELADVEWGTLVFDEAQALKNPATQRARAARAIGAKFTIALTGTPVENRSEELWSIFRVVVPDLLGKRETFHHRFAVPIERYGEESASRALAALISPFVLRRLKRDVASELPDRLEVRLDVELGPAERHIYDSFRAEFLAALDSRDEVERFEVLAAITRLRQLACHPGLVDPALVGASSKLSALADRVTELVSEGQRALVFSQFTSLLDLVEPVLDEAGVSYLRIDGSTPARQREALVDRFQNREVDVFLLSTKAGGQGLNLTAATAVFHLDPWWNPAVEDQATDRAHRIGQAEPVTVYRMLSVGTIEEAIFEIHADKRALVDSLLAGSGSARSLSPDELKLLIGSSGYRAPED